jgi:hypothetical protein
MLVRNKVHYSIKKQRRLLGKELKGGLAWNL